MMRTTFLVSTVILGTASVLAADTYPASFPFENEYGEGIPDLNFPAATPSYTYGTTDKGGYELLRMKCDYAAEMKKDVLYDAKGKEIANGRTKEGNGVLHVKSPQVPSYLNISENSWTPWFCPGAQYSAKTYIMEKDADITRAKVKCTVPKAMKQQWNTKWADKIASGDQKSFDKYIGQEVLPTGALGEKVECTDCCLKFNQDDFDHTKRAGIRVWIPPTTLQRTIQDFMRGDSCSISMGEAAKCFIVESYNNICVQNYVSASKRAFLYPCPDIFLRHYYSCKLRMASAIVANSPEPPMYAKTVSAKQSTSLLGVNRLPDKVCQPYSYFYPALKKPAGSTDYYSPNSALGKNDPSGGAPAAPGATPAQTPKSGSSPYHIVFTLGFVMALTIFQ